MNSHDDNHTGGTRNDLIALAGAGLAINVVMLALIVITALSMGSCA